MSKLRPSPGGRNYVPVADRPGGLAHRPSTTMHLLGRPLLTLNSLGKLPISGDVTRLVRGRQVTETSRSLKEIISCPLIKNTANASCLTHCQSESSPAPCVVSAVKTDSWLLSGLPLKKDKAIGIQITKIYTEWKNRCKDKGKSKVAGNIAVSAKDKKFIEDSNKVFDISVPNVRTVIAQDRLRSEEAKQNDLDFIKDQFEGDRNMVVDTRDKGRDTVYDNSVTGKEKRKQRLSNLGNDNKKTSEAVADNGSEDEKTEDDDDEEFKESKCKKKRKHDENYITVRLPRDILSEDTVISSKRFGLGNQGATNVVASIIQRAKQVNSEKPVDINEFTLSRTTTQRRVGQSMKIKADDRKKAFKAKLRTLPNTFWINFDGADSKQLSGQGRIKETKHRLSLYLDSPDLKEPPQLLGVPVVLSSKGIDQFSRVATDLEEWEATNKVCGASTDTAADITGWKKGAIGRLARFLKRDILTRACRRHSAERHIMKAAKLVFGNTKSPHWAIFKEIHDIWPTFCVDDDHSGIDYDDLEFYEWGKDQDLDKRAGEVLAWGLAMLADNTFDRGDYRNLVKYLVVWLGGAFNIPGFKFRTPGAFHFARYYTFLFQIMTFLYIQVHFAVSVCDAGCNGRSSDGP